jgi:hypothetical protein
VEGVHQGDPIGPLLFAIGIQPLLNMIRDAFPVLNLHAWYLDDGNIVAPAEVMSPLVDFIRLHAPTFGLELVLSKCSLWSPTGVFPACLPSEIPFDTCGFTKVLGHVISFDVDHFNSGVSPVISEISTVIDKLFSLKDSQMAFWLLRFCVGLPKFQHLLRTAPPDFIRSSASSFDALVEGALSKLVNEPSNSLPTSNLRLAYVPISDGGMGLTSASSVSHPAFLASVYSCSEMVAEITGAVSASTWVQSFQPYWTSFASEGGSLPRQLENFSSVTPNLGSLVNLQKSIFRTAAPTRLRVALEPFSDIDVNRFNAQLPLNSCVTHYPTLENRFSSTDWCILARSRLLLPVVTSSFQCLCGSVVDIYGSHCPKCARRPGLVDRHDGVRNVLSDTLRSAAVRFRSEFRVSGLPSQPGDLVLLNWSSNIDRFLDVSVVDGLHGISSPSFAVGSVVSSAVSAKVLKHAAAISALGASFTPLVVSNFATFSAPFSAFLQELSNRLRFSPFPPSVKVLRKKIVFSLSQSFARSVRVRGHLVGVLF